MLWRRDKAPSSAITVPLLSRPQHSDYTEINITLLLSLILKLDLQQRRGECVNWIHLAQDSVQQSALVNMLQ